MLRIVLPGIVGTIRNICIAVDVRVGVTNEVIVVIDVDVVVATPAATPAPAASAERGAHHYADSK